MGADGGIGWVRVKNRTMVSVYVDWLLSYVANSDAYAYRGEWTSSPDVDYPSWGDYIEGAYGTDCDCSLRELCDAIHFIISDDDDWAAKSGSDDIRLYTFAELIEAIQTDPDPDLQYKRDLVNPWCNIRPIFNLARYMAFDDRYKIIPDKILTMTLKEWAAKVSEAIDTDSWYGTETWT